MKIFFATMLIAAAFITLMLAAMRRQYEKKLRVWRARIKVGDVAQLDGDDPEVCPVVRITDIDHTDIYVRDLDGTMHRTSRESLFPY